MQIVGLGVRFGFDELDLVGRADGPGLDLEPLAWPFLVDLGVRWAVYGTGKNARQLVSKMRKLGFLCAERTRTLLIRSKENRFLEAANWRLNDAIFSFHH